MKRITAILLVLLVADLAGAKLCGDDVGGQDVPCACGDIVVSNLLLDDDPVAGATCEGHGLLVRITGDTEVTIDLGGKTLRGTGGGHGIMVVHGGIGGTRITSNPRRASIQGFEHGVSAAGGDVSLLENVDVRGAAFDGIRLRGPGHIRNCTVSRAGRDGFSLSGRDVRATSNQSRNNGRHGFMVMGQGGSFSSNQASNCGSAGFLVTGSGHSVEECVAEYCGRNGLELVTTAATIRSCIARDNGASGIEGHGAGWRLTGNTATRNGEHGIKARGPGMVDEGGNSGADNGSAAGSEVEQCRIGDVPCTAAVVSDAH